MPPRAAKIGGGAKEALERQIPTKKRKREPTRLKSG
jgi:hypothetical protein